MKFSQVIQVSTLHLRRVLKLGRECSGKKKWKKKKKEESLWGEFDWIKKDPEEEEEDQYQSHSDGALTDSQKRNWQQVKESQDIDKEFTMPAVDPTESISAGNLGDKQDKTMEDMFQDFLPAGKKNKTESPIAKHKQNDERKNCNAPKETFVVRVGDKQDKTMEDMFQDFLPAGKKNKTESPIAKHKQNDERKNCNAPKETFVVRVGPSAPEISDHSQFPKLSDSGNIRIEKTTQPEEAYKNDVNLLESFLMSKKLKKTKNVEVSKRSEFQQHFSLQRIKNLNASFLMPKTQERDQKILFEVEMSGKTSKEFLGAFTGLVAKKLRKDCTKEVLESFFEEMVCIPDFKNTTVTFRHIETNITFQRSF
eukprot:GHVP01043458.1.p1 GENE.GHVP01043458.1~~GHVP01043458.1.p1  ORF type:complete len:366 (-),score=97.88 GHVP01043458.1:56-1153(-)